LDRKLINILLAEFIGTFALVFIGAAVVATLSVTDNNGSGAVVVPALGHGLIVIGMIYAFGAVSGGHFNPAVTVAMLVAGKIDVLKAVLYWVAQFAAAIVAAVLFAGLVSSAPGVHFGQTVGVLTATDLTSSAILEAIATFLFVTVIYQVAVHGRGGTLAPIAIGFTLAAAILAIGVYTGASLNPARTLGPALAAGDLSYVPAYFIGIFAGGILAGLFNAYVMKPEPFTVVVE
jgi:MIP family channel proteins